MADNPRWTNRPAGSTWGDVALTTNVGGSIC
jgi:hypothetical protein